MSGVLALRRVKLHARINTGSRRTSQYELYPSRSYLPKSQPMTHVGLLNITILGRFSQENAYSASGYGNSTCWSFFCAGSDKP